MLWSPKFFVVTFLALLFSASSYAMLLTADPDIIWTDPASAHVIDNAFEGVTFSTNVDNRSVLALGGGVFEVVGWAPAIFGHGLINLPSGGCSGCWSFGFAELRADFDVLVEAVTVDFIDRFTGTAIVEAYTMDGVLIGSSESILNGHPAIEAERISVHLHDPNSSIAYILAGASNGSYGVIDKVSWNPTPVSEPISISLFIVALIIMVFLRKYKARAFYADSRDHLITLLSVKQ